LDRHRRYFTLFVLTSEGEVVCHHRRLPAELEPLTSLLRELGGPVTVALEATLQWPWLHDRLTAAGFTVLVAHPKQVKLISHARCKTDPIDTRKLADLARTNLLPTIWVPSPEIRAWRQLLRGRATLVRWRTRAKNRIHGALAAENLRVGATDLFGRAGREWLERAPVSAGTRREITVQLAVIAALDEQVRGYDTEVKRLAKPPEAQRLQTIPGIGPFGAALLVAEIGEISRFPTAHDFAAYAGLVPRPRVVVGTNEPGGVGVDDPEGRLVRLIRSRTPPEPVTERTAVAGNRRTGTRAPAAVRGRKTPLRGLRFRGTGHRHGALPRPDASLPGRADRGHRAQ
jgi:transposase